MCLHIFSAGKRLELDYVAETITVERGGSEEIIDMLVTNHSDEEIDRIHVVYPHALPAFPEQKPDDKRTFQDLTATLIDAGSSHNRMYRSRGEPRIAPQDDGGYEVAVSLRDLQNPAITNPYRGVVRGHLKLTRYQLKDVPLNNEEWDVLSRLDWAVITIHFDSPIKRNEARWLRVFGRGGRRAHNEHRFLEYWYRKLCEQLVDTFRIEGPLDVRDSIVARLRGVDEFYPKALDYHMKLRLSGIIEKVLVGGIEADDTTTAVRDWRLNIFWNRYRRVPDPVPSGDIVASSLGEGTIAKCHQFRAGDRNKVATTLGKFVVSVRAHDIPVIVPGLPWISVVLAVVSLILSIILFFKH